MAPYRLAALFALYWTFLLNQATRTSATILDFDDLAPPPPFYRPIYSPPEPYHQLSFSAFSVFDPKSSRLEGLISQDDRNCAVSRPNALLGSRFDGGYGTKPSFQVGEEHRNDTSFDLLGLAVKPLTAPPGNEEIVFWIQGYRTKSTSESTIQLAEPLLWHVEFPVEYHLNFPVALPDEWQHLQKIEMWAQYGPGKLDWEFCIDDLQLQFRKEGDRVSHLELRGN